MSIPKDDRSADRRSCKVDALQTGLPQTVVAMLSSNMDRAGHDARNRKRGSI